MDKYAKQDRGELSDYEEYFAGMDASMQQKIALTTAHFPSRGLIADMGSGSGSGTFDLAKLYRHLELVGVDINPVTVEYSNDHFQAKNLKYRVGDIAEKVFPAGSLDGILDSSVLHHVTSFNNYDRAQITKTLKNQVAQLKTGGVLIIRDFVVPDESEKVIFLDLPTSDGTDEGEIPELSTAALFEIFARDFRSSLNMNGPVLYRELPCPRPAFRRFETTMRTAAEFVLRKDYRDHWAPELIEEYTYFSQADFENAFRKENLRIVVSMPLWNPWIVENRFRDRFFISDAAEKPVTFPPTNFLIVGEKVPAGAGVFLREKCRIPLGEKVFLDFRAYRHKETGRVFELAERPNRTIDLLPWFETEIGQIFVLAKKDFPRPIVNAENGRANLNRANYSGYLTEPISAIVKKNSDSREGSVEGEQENIESKRRCSEILSERAGLSAGDVLEISRPQIFFTSPGGLDERVESYLVKIEERSGEPHEIENYTNFSSAGSVRELDALQTLRASHVGGMFDARLEINIYRLLRHLGRSASAWIGAQIEPKTQSSNARIEDAAGLSPERREMFESLNLTEYKFLRHEKSVFVETNARNEEIARTEFEYVVPEHFSKNTVAAIPFFRTGDGIFVGVEFRDLPAPQRFSGSSLLACVPAWRLAEEIEHKFDLETFMRERFPKDFHVLADKIWELGGSFFTSAGVTPEIVYPSAVELEAENLRETDLRFFRLHDLLAETEKISDGHFLILLNRLAHALGF